MSPSPVFFVSPEVAPVPPLLGGAPQAWLSEVVPRVAAADPPGAERVVLLSPAHPGLPLQERVGAALYRRLQVSPAAGAVVSRLPASRSAVRFWLEGVAWARAVGRAVAGTRGTIVLVNRPWLLRIVRRAAPDARLVLRLDNVHLHDRRAIRRCAGVMTCSRFVLEALERTVGPPRRAAVLPSGADLDRHHVATPDERARAKRELGVADRPVVLFVGRVTREKGVHLLLEAVPELRRRHPDIAVVLVGSAAFGRPSATRYEREVAAIAAREAQSVVLAGFVPPERLGRFWSAADVFCAPALWEEPFGAVYVESMASGVPPVATRRGGIPEILSDGETGVLLPLAPRAGDVAERVADLLDDPTERARMGRRGRELAERRFSWAAIAADTTRFLEEVGVDS